MGLYIYAPATFPGTQELIDALKAKRLRRFDGMHFWHKNTRLTFTKNDAIVCWGQCLPLMEPQRMLNSSDRVSTVVSLSPCLGRLLDLGIDMILPLTGTKKTASTVSHPLDTILTSLEKKNSVMISPDFPGPRRRWVHIRRMETEYELHVFGSKLIYARVKVPVLPVASSEKDWVLGNHVSAHPWYKSTITGWKSTPCNLENIDLIQSGAERFAIDIVKYLNLTFGVVYLGRSTRSWVIRKVSITPELDDNAVKAYAEQITEWLEQPKLKG